MSEPTCRIYRWSHPGPARGAAGLWAGGPFTITLRTADPARHAEFVPETMRRKCSRYGHPFDPSRIRLDSWPLSPR